MNKILCLLFAVLLSNLSNGLLAQPGTGDHFNDNFLSCNWNGNGTYNLSEANGRLQVNTNLASGSYQVFLFSFPSINVSATPVVTLSIQSAIAMQVRVDLTDNNGKSTNGNPVVKSVAGSNNMTVFTFDFTNRFFQTFPNNASVNPSAITNMLVFFNPGGSAFNGTVFFDDLQIGSAGGSTNGHADNCPGLPVAKNRIRLNQVGFYPAWEKLAIVEGNVSGPNFYVKSPDLGTTYFSGTLGAGATWAFSNEFVKAADFSSFKTPGQYVLEVEGIAEKSPLFSILPQVNSGIAKAAIKAFYFNRASTPLLPAHAGVWQRTSGHPDNNVLIHASAATAARPAGTVVSSTKGWYDAGDYNCYVVNSGITMHNLLSAYEHFPAYYDTLMLNIPESSNQLPDLLDEAKWNLDWMLTMQDPNDGGVYHKKTTLNFSGAVMPAADNATRYLVAKSSAATFDFAAVMAMAYRVFKKYDEAFANQCLAAAQSAYQWGMANPNIYFTNPAGVTTGEYGDGNTTDEKEWAATELYISTSNESYYSQSFKNSQFYGLPAWPAVRSLGLISLVHHRKQLTALGKNDTAAMKLKLVNLANTSALHKPNSPYRTSMGSNGNNDFNWGSNSNALNYGMVNIAAYLLTGEREHLNLTLSSLDYVLGRNATSYCFVTGFGSKQVMNPHHRPSYADGIANPVPGWVAGGPNTDAQTDCGAAAYPSSTYRAIAYVDSWCSYSTNEVAINWNGPLVFVTGALEALWSVHPLSYRFVGSGNWTLASNWENNWIPPAKLPSGSSIHINPSGNNEAILDTPVWIEKGGSLEVISGKKLLINGNVQVW